MLKLRTILLYNWLYYFFLGLALIYCFGILFNEYYQTNYNLKTTFINGYINNIKIDGNQLQLEIISPEKIIVNYYIKEEKEKNYFLNNLILGDFIQSKGVIEKPRSNTIFNLFDYKKYLYSKKIYWIFKAESLIKTKNNNKIRYFVKNKIKKNIEKSLASNYLKTFILGDKVEMNKNVMRSYQNNGISHLFAISGMHVSLLSTVILFILKKCKVSENKRYISIIFFLLFYLFLTDFAPSIMRATMFFTLLAINKIFYFNIKLLNIFIVTFSILLIYNPYYIYNVGFQLSFCISLFLILFQENLNSSKNIFLNLLKISFISFLASSPLVINNFYSLNFLSIINNIIFVPFVTFILFPLSLLTYFISFLEPLLLLCVKIFENLSILLNKISILTFTFAKPPIFVIILYYILIIPSLYYFFKRKYFFLILLGVAFLVHYHINYLNQNIYYYTIDVGQGDSALIINKNNAYLIDTGGKLEYKQEDWQTKENKYSIAKDALIPFFKSLGIKRIKYLILSHGDEDHAGEAINLINNFPVNQIILNKGKLNNLEKKIIFTAKQKAITLTFLNDYYLINDLNLKINNISLKDYNDENNNSIISIMSIYKNTVLLTGDISVEVEKDFIKKVFFNKVDFLKLAHHGSKTSSCNEFLKHLNPDNVIISVGLNNKFNHPSEEVISRIKNIKTYMTSSNGSIKVTFNRQKHYSIITAKHIIK